MSPPTPHHAAADNGLREMARRPRESDGVGNALRQVFGDPCGLPADFRVLLNRLNNNA